MTKKTICKNSKGYMLLLIKIFLSVENTISFL
nr:MAG TPA: hypothetical protein [Caudoviricetes sp.]